MGKLGGMTHLNARTIAHASESHLLLHYTHTHAHFIYIYIYTIYWTVCVMAETFLLGALSSLHKLQPIFSEARNTQVCQKSEEMAK